LIGVNALNKRETQNVLAVIRAAFEKPETIAPDAGGSHRERWYSCGIWSN
jgi:hypothetical protein